MINPVARVLLSDPSSEAIAVAADLVREGRWGSIDPHELYLITGAPGPLELSILLAREEGGAAEQRLLCGLAEMLLTVMEDEQEDGPWFDGVRGCLAPLWGHLAPYADAGRLAVGLERDSLQVRILAARAGLPSETWRRIWPTAPATLTAAPCVEPVLDGGDLELAPANGRVVVPLANAARAVAYVCQCPPADWGPLLDAAVIDRRDDDYFELLSGLNGDGDGARGYRWDGCFTRGRWLEAVQVSATEAEVSWESGTGNPSLYLGRALAYAGLLGLWGQPTSPPFGALADAMQRALER